MRFGSAFALALALVVVAAATAEAHIALRFPTPRTSDQKAGPCGSSGSKRGSKITHFNPGETITVEWDETVQHPGHFRIAFDDDGNDDFVNPNNPNDAFASTLVEPIADTNNESYTQEVTLPNITCDNCTLQLVQVMTTSVPFNSFYFQCADITLGDGPSDTPDDATTSGGCSTSGSSSAGGSGALLLAIAGVLARRRRRA